MKWKPLAFLALLLACNYQLVTVTPSNLSTPSPQLSPMDESTSPSAPSPLPTPVPSSSSPLIQVKKTPECLEVLSMNYEVIQAGVAEPTVVGEIQNNCSTSFSGINVQFILLDSLTNIVFVVEDVFIGPLAVGERRGLGSFWHSLTSSERNQLSRGGRWDTVVIGIRGTEASSGSKCPGTQVELDVEIKDGSAVITNGTRYRIVGYRIWRTGYDADGIAVASEQSFSMATDVRPGGRVRENPGVGSVTRRYSARLREPVRWVVRACGTPGN